MRVMFDAIEEQVMNHWPCNLAALITETCCFFAGICKSSLSLPVHAVTCAIFYTLGCSCNSASLSFSRSFSL